MIYFLQDSATLNIKIGFTSGDADARKAALQTGNPSPLVLLGTAEGEAFAESALHRRFAAFRVAGEWFLPAPPLIEAIVKFVAAAQLRAVTEFLRTVNVFGFAGDPNGVFHEAIHKGLNVNAVEAAAELLQLDLMAFYDAEAGVTRWIPRSTHIHGLLVSEAHDADEHLASVRSGEFMEQCLEEGLL